MAKPEPDSMDTTTTALDRNISRHELKIKHGRLTKRAKSIKDDYMKTQRMLQEFNDSCFQLYENFPLCHYRKLKVLIKNFVSKDKIKDLKKKVQKASEAGEDTSESQTDEVDSDSDNDGRPLIAGGKPHGRVKQALRKVEKFCGFDSDPIEDEDVMSDSELLLSMERKRKSISFHHKEMAKTLKALKSLKKKYIRSKGTFALVRFSTLKNMVREMNLKTTPDRRCQ